MTTKAMGLTKTPTIGRVEKGGLVATGILIAVNALIGSRDIAVGAAVGGILVITSFFATKLVVGALIRNAYPKGLTLLVLLIKMAIPVAIAVSLFVFTRINIYGFLIGVTGVVIVILGETLRGKKHGTL